MHGQKRRPYSCSIIVKFRHSQKYLIWEAVFRNPSKHKHSNLDTKGSSFLHQLSKVILEVDQGVDI